MEQLLNYVFDIADNPIALFAVLFTAALLNTFLPPVPIEIGTVFAGYLASEGHGSLFNVILATTLGMFAGSAVFYRIAAFYGISILRKPFFAKLVKEKTLNRAKAWFEKYGALSLFFARFVPGMYFCAITISATLKLKPLKMYLTLFFVNLAAFTVLAFAGKIAGENWQKVYAALGKAGSYSLAAAALVAILVYAAAKLLRKKPQRLP